MSASVKFNDNSDAVLSAVHANVLRALTAMGQEAVGQTMKQKQMPTNTSRTRTIYPAGTFSAGGSRSRTALLFLSFRF